MSIGLFDEQGTVRSPLWFSAEGILTRVIIGTTSPSDSPLKQARRTYADEAAVKP